MTSKDDKEYQGDPPFEYNQITEQIYLGTNACCITHFKDELIEKGILADLSMEKERLDAAQGVEYFLWLPTVDHEAPTLEKLKAGSSFMRELIEAGEKIYVHCKNGHGRAPTMVAAYFVLMGDSVDEAIEKIKEKRSVIHPEPVQIEMLREFESWCRSK